MHVPEAVGNNEARLPFSSRDKSVSSNLGESVISELEMPKDDKTGSNFQGKRHVIHLQYSHQMEPSQSQDEKSEHKSGGEEELEAALVCLK